MSALLVTPDRPLLNPEQLITYIARVSNPENQNNVLTADKLIRYLTSNKHWSPLDMVDMTVEIKASRAITRQILRHRSFCFQEFSQRYAEVAAMEEIQLRRQAEKNRQSSTEEFDPQIDFVYDGRRYTMAASDAIKDHMAGTMVLYESLIKANVAKESARFILPEVAMTTMYMKGSVRSWVHYLQLRLDEHTQLEHRQVAQRIFTIFKLLFPDIVKALWETSP